jgi:hypothetical protein
LVSSQADTDEPELSQPSWSQPQNFFDKLCGHDIIEIMERLPMSSRLNLAATSKRFNDTLKKNPNRLPIKLNINFDTEDLPILERIYRTVKIRNLTTPDDEDRLNCVMAVFDQLMEEVYDFKIFSSDITAKLLYDVLKKMPQISTFYVGSSTEIAKLQFQETEPLTLAKLKRVTVHHRNVLSMGAILNDVTTMEEFVFKSQNDEEVDEFANELAIWIDMNEDSDNEENNEVAAPPVIFFAPIHNALLVESLANEVAKYVEIKNVLRRQRNLRLLEFSNAYIFENPFDDCAFQLRHLVLFIPSASLKQLKNIYNFIKTQTHLESVVINILCDDNAENRLVLEDIFTYVMELRSVNTIKVVFYSGLGMIEHFRDTRCVNPNVKELYLGLVPVPHSHRRIMEAVVRHFPNLNKLDLCLEETWMRYANADTFAPLSNLTKLKVLRLENGESEFVSNIRTLSLESVSFRGIFSTERGDWQQFYTNNPNLVNLDFQFHPLRQPENIVHFVQDITTRLNRIRKVHVCTCGREFSDEEKGEITDYFNASQSMKKISFCGWKQEKE